MAPAAALLDLWGADESDPHIDVDCLLPTGVLVPLRVLKDNSLIEIKEVGLSYMSTSSQVLLV